MPEREQTYTGPTNLHDCVAALKANLSAQDTEKIKAVDLETFRTGAHFGLGMHVRNTFLLPNDSPIAAYLKGKGVFHEDNMSSLILTR